MWSILHGHRHLIQAGESGYGDIHPHAGTICFSAINSGVFVYLLKGIFPLRDHLDVFLAKFYFLSTEQRFMCWCSAMNLVFVYFLFDGGHMNVDQSQGRKSVDPQPFKTDSPSSFFFFFFVMVYSWRDFGKARTSWKIQCCPRVLPHMYRMKLAGNKLIPGAFGMSREEFSDRQASTISHWKS